MKIFWMLTEDQQRDLISYQFRTYKTHLTIPHRPKELGEVSMDGIEMDEVGMAKFMQQRPHSPRKVK